MKHGYVFKEPRARWYEPQHLLLGSSYYMHAYGRCVYETGDGAGQGRGRDEHLDGAEPAAMRCGPKAPRTAA